jgi:Methyltransferase FkbM domain
MYVDEPGSAKNTLSRKWVDSLRSDPARFGQKLAFRNSSEIETTTLEQVTEDYGQPFFIKIDVEGHEPEVLRGLRRPLPFLSYEVNLPEFRGEALECIDILNTLDSKGTFNYAIDCGRGLALGEWLDARTFLDRLANCTEQSIEVFWKTRPAQ